MTAKKNGSFPGLMPGTVPTPRWSVEWQGIRIGVRSAAVDGKFFLQISPVRQSPGDALVVDPQMLWGRPGEIGIEGGTDPCGHALRPHGAGRSRGTIFRDGQELEVFAG
ncbi:MAG: hypothetical protein MZV63_13670 [Marinilabiliales bacterium]|nr:hypothetical protein [Marinilabiliales bacterium]